MHIDRLVFVSLHEHWCKPALILSRQIVLLIGVNVDHFQIILISQDGAGLEVKLYLHSEWEDVQENTNKGNKKIRKPPKPNNETMGLPYITMVVTK